MADTTDLIRRARELAKLAEKATPGPWHPVDSTLSAPLLGRTVVINHSDGVSSMQIRSRAESRAPLENDLRLICATHAMARLLGELADELEHLRKPRTFQCTVCGAKWRITD